MSREFIFEPEAKCDVCGEEGAFDIYGDYFCSDCLAEDEAEANVPLHILCGENNYNWNRK